MTWGRGKIQEESQGIAVIADIAVIASLTPITDTRRHEKGKPYRRFARIDADLKTSPLMTLMGQIRRIRRSFMEKASS